MVERLRTGFMRLFEVRVFHHFWLDDGTTVFDAMADDDIKARRLLAYDIRRVLRSTPSDSTAVAIAGLRGVFRTTGLGFLVAVPDDTVMALDTTFEFFLTVETTAYANYTSLTLRPTPLVDVTDPATGTVRRYKANVPVLSNLTGAARGTGSTKRLFLSQEFVAGPDAGDGVEALVTSGTSLRQLTGDPPDAPFHVLGPKSGHPVYVHQGDAPEITPPPGSSGAPARGVELSSDTPPDVAAVIRLSPRRADDAAFGFIEANGRPRTPARVFEVHLRNRWTTWQYRKRDDGSITSTEAAPLPLTYFGNAGTKQKPSSDGIVVELDDADPPRITRLVSDIYV